MNMAPDLSTPWHRASYEAFLHERLPQLLGERLPLASYRVEYMSDRSCRIVLSLAMQTGDVPLDFAGLPQPDDEGIFMIDGTKRVVVPLASSEDLSAAEVRCVGEQLYSFIEARLGQVGADMPADPSLLRALVPLDKWFAEFFLMGLIYEDASEPKVIHPTSQALDVTNWLATQTHLRRILIENPHSVIHPGQMGRACPFETPEGPNIGRVLSLACGATIRNGKIIVVDDAPAAALGLTASMVPFVEHDDANRLLMGVNMMRQWQVPLEPEPALVQTGKEPSAAGFWCGVNLLTAFVSWGGDTYEDGLLISESCTRRFRFEHPVEPGDKLSNRHGQKGVISRIAPDDEMPHLADGTPVELVCNFIGLHSRMIFGQVCEALAGRIARAEGTPVVAPPFHAPNVDELRERLRRAGLPASGMEILTIGKDGPPLQRPSTIGWIYWGRTVHDVRTKLHTFVSTPGEGQEQGELEYYALREAGAFENVAESFNTRSARRSDAATLAARLAAGPVEQAPPPPPWFADLMSRLAAASIKATLDEEKLHFKMAAPSEPALTLARPLPHPWLAEIEVAAVGVRENDPFYHALAQANARAERALASGAPEVLTHQTLHQLRKRLTDYFDGLVPHEIMLPSERNLFSGRSVIIPGGDLTFEQVGLPEGMAWELFGPILAREMGDSQEIANRTPRVAAALDKLMARSWVVVNRQPSFWAASLLAFHPVRVPGRAIRLHPLACPLLNADFDGDPVAVFLPITEAAQREAGERLSVVGQLRRDPERLLPWLCPTQDALWGLAALSFDAARRDEIRRLTGADLIGAEGFVTRASLIEGLRAIHEAEGPQRALQVSEALMRLGMRIAKESGASFSPFFGESVSRPPLPAIDRREEWLDTCADLTERIASRVDYDAADLGPQLLAVKSGARGNLQQLVSLPGTPGVVIDGAGGFVPVHRGFAEGLRPEDAFARVFGARLGLARVLLEPASLWHAYAVEHPGPSKGFNVLARAMRARRPGVVFARAAAIGEIDPLADLDSRLLVGLPAK